MIDYYYEFPTDSKLFGTVTKYAIQRGYHPEESDVYQVVLHQNCYMNALRIWIENANGLTLIREYGRDIHKKCDPKIMTWIKLQAREL